MHFFAGTGCFCFVVLKFFEKVLTMKKICFLLSMLLACAVFSAEKPIDIKNRDFYLKGTLTVTKDLEPGIYYIVRNDGRRINMNVLLKKYPQHDNILFHTVRMKKDGKPFVLERSHRFKTGQKHVIEIKYADGKAQLFFDKKLWRDMTCDVDFKPGSFKNISKEPILFTVEEFSDAPAAAKK